MLRTWRSSPAFYLAAALAAAAVVAAAVQFLRGGEEEPSSVRGSAAPTVSVSASRNREGNVSFQVQPGAGFDPDRPGEARIEVKTPVVAPPPSGLPRQSAGRTGP